MEQTKLKKREKGRKKKFGDINLAEYSKKHMAPKGTNLASVIYVCDEREKIITTQVALSSVRIKVCVCLLKVLLLLNSFIQGMKIYIGADYIRYGRTKP